ncbi:SCO family protein [Candidatus Marinarcus aquaticus]|uniref:SCO family protein n=1 Tax=Candidatus Marinarcus aquaticus TaxID=2044504 RepID=A0A4Q0XT70_9BACT|nr:SCO family protein [Candidatus Marinarcus aquaticus]RXJ60586.1 SCO family protein [Candidatus Marinarcus aquaticus]
MKKLITFGIPVIIAIVAILFLKPIIEQSKEQKKYAFTVSTIKGDVSKEDFKGKVLAVYFGYTFCPDVCPTSLSSLAQALSDFSPEQLKSFRGLFISVDPDRDTLENLKEYAQYFHPTFLGATSNKKNIDDITQRYGTFYEKIYLKDSKMDYSVSHTSYIYIFDKQGNFVAKVDHFSDPNKIKESLETLLK